MDRILIDQLRAFGIIGLHDWERSRAQEILIDAALELDLRAVGASDQIANSLDYGVLTRDLVAHAEAAERFTVEALATDLAGMCLHRPQVRIAQVTVSKPGADPHARRIGACIERTKADLERRAVIGLGSNVSPETHLPQGVDRLNELGGILQVSAAYQSDAHSDQPAYVNAAVMLQTCLPPVEIRRRLKNIERELGRVPCDATNVPIDLDLVLFGDIVVRTGGVSIPDPDILERPYLARTIADLDDSLTHPESGERIGSIADRLCNRDAPRRREDIALSFTRVERA